MGFQLSTKWKIVLLILIVAVLSFLYIRFDAAMYLTHENLEKLVNQAGPFGPLVFGLIYFVAAVIFLPVSALSVIAGLLFGAGKGVLVVVTAATLAAQTAFGIARFFGSDVSKKFEQIKFTQKFAKKLESAVEENGFKAFFIMRCLFVPYIPASYAAGFIPTAKARHFFLATLITNLIFSPAFVYFGEQIFNGPKALILPAVLIALVLGVPHIVKKVRKKEAKQFAE